MSGHYGRWAAAAALALSLATPRAARGQEVGEEPAWSYGASLDVASSFIWRGLELSGDPNLQPGVWAAYGPLEVGTWGSYALNGDYSEQDFWVTYYLPETSFGAFALSVNDYYIDDDFGAGFSNFDGVVDCSEDEGVGDPPRCAGGTHTLEVAGTFSPAATPLELLVAYNFHNDPQSALYAETSFTPEVRGFELGFTAGGVLGESNWYYENDGAALTNLSARIGRTLETERFSIPVGFEVVNNPHHEKTFFVARLGVAAEF